jgi:exosortase/archaeosortase family protein
LALLHCAKRKINKPLAGYFQNIICLYNSKSRLDRFIIRSIFFFLLYLLLSLLFKYYIPLAKWMMLSITYLSARLIELLGYDIDTDLNLITVNGMDCIRVIKTCLAKRPLVIFVGFLFAYPGTIRFKAWYIPLGLAALFAFNVFRISTLTLITYHNPDKYAFFHDIVFKTSFYVIIFGLWLLSIKLDPLPQKEKETA